MAERKSKGTPMPGNATLDHALGALRGSLGDANMQDRGLGHGDYKDGSNVGSFDSVKAELLITTAGTFTVPHNLGRVPGWVRIWETEIGSDPTAVIQCASFNKAAWTRTTFQVRVSVQVGSAAGVKVHFEVGGGS